MRKLPSGRVVDSVPDEEEDRQSQVEQERDLMHDELNLPVKTVGVETARYGSGTRERSRVKHGVPSSPYGHDFEDGQLTEY